MEIANLIIAILSLIATVAVSVAIFWLQRRHERENERQAEIRHKESIQESAKIFIIDNQEEIDILPLCVIAASVDPYKKHKRLIYTRFNKCSKELQEEILRQENIPLAILDSSSWVDACLNKFEADCKKYKMGRSFLYDGGKYFHCAISDLQNEALGDISTFIFDVPSLGRVIFPDHKSDLTLYIDRYLEFVLRDREDTANTPERLPQEPPMDMLNRMFNFGLCELKVLNFWLMKFISSGCVAFCRHNLIEDNDAEWRQICIEDGQIETYEDMYYDTLLMLYTTYWINANKDRGRKKT